MLGLASDAGRPGGQARERLAAVRPPWSAASSPASAPPVGARRDPSEQDRAVGPPTGASNSSDVPSAPSPEVLRRESVARALEAFGLRKSASRLYCASLSLGPSLPLDIIVNARVRRATGYRGLERLRRLELVVPVTHRPLKIEAIPLARFLDRSATALLDEVALHREMREAAAETLTRSSSLRALRGPVLVAPGDVSRVIQESLELARKEVQLMPVLKGLPTEARARLREGVDAALARGVRVRILVPFERSYLRALPVLSRAAELEPRLEVRLSEPAFFHLYVVDASRAIRFFVRSTMAERPEGPLGVVSEGPSFVQAQDERFRTLWSDAARLESSPREPRSDRRPPRPRGAATVASRQRVAPVLPGIRQIP